MEKDTSKQENQGKETHLNRRTRERDTSKQEYQGKDTHLNRRTKEKRHI